MISIKAKEITEIDYSRYGILFNLSGEGKSTNNTNHSEGDGWSDNDTAFPVIDTTGRLGFTYGEKQPFVLKTMERHSHTQEAQILTDQSVVICFSEYKGETIKAEDVEAVIIRPGYVFTVHRDIWHSPSHGVDYSGRTYWLADVFDDEPTYWADIENGPIYISV